MIKQIVVLESETGFHLEGGEGGQEELPPK